MPILVELSPRALRDLKDLEKAAAGEILDDLKILQARPWPGPPKVKKLEGHKNLYRIRTGDYRSLFEPTVKGVVVLRVLDRKELERILRNL
ncbi:MAG TPA: type II toxin-antitoxin system RelE/ParE family toxin [bacterium]|nr:type II toxin-antitoxin system RelE/ParE family toxin [bacterium]